MSWAHGVDKYGREVGYAIQTKCEEFGCDAEIDKGLGCRCGGISNLSDEIGCGHFFCGEHLYLTSIEQLCKKCLETLEKGSSDE